MLIERAFELPYRPQATSMTDDPEWRQGALDLARDAPTSIGLDVHAAEPSDRMPLDALKSHPDAGIPVGYLFYAKPDPLLEAIGVVHVDPIGIVRLLPAKHWDGPWPLAE